MSRLDDLIDLIQTTNEVYFITAPARVRTAYILADDIVELTLKTFLQEKALAQQEQFLSALQQDKLVKNRSDRDVLKEYYEEKIDLQKLIVELKLDSSQVILLQNHINSLVPINLLQHWSVNDPDDFKKYYEVVRDVKNFFLSNSLTFTMLDEIALRHQERNSLYHDHKQSGLSINDDKCLRALCGMFDLMEQLFPGSPTTDSFHYLAQRNKTVRCQIGVLRLKLSAHGSTELEEPYLAALRQFNKEHKITIDSKNFEHSVLHTISERFFIAIESHLGSKVDVLQKKLSDQITKLGQMHTDNQISQQRAKIADSEHQVTVLSEQLAIIKGLIATP